MIFVEQKRVIPCINEKFAHRHLCALNYAAASSTFDCAFDSSALYPAWFWHLRTCRMRISAQISNIFGTYLLSNPSLTELLPTTFTLTYIRQYKVYLVINVYKSVHRMWFLFAITIAIVKNSKRFFNVSKGDDSLQNFLSVELGVKELETSHSIQKYLSRKEVCVLSLSSVLRISFLHLTLDAKRLRGKPLIWKQTTNSASWRKKWRK